MIPQLVSGCKGKMVATGKVGRPRQPNEDSGGDNPIPRSLGDVFRSIRVHAGKSQKEMLEAIEAVDSVYKLPKPKGKSQKRSAASVSNWETAEDNVPFAVQFRYAALVDTFSGVLHLISLFHANLRDAVSGKDASHKLKDNRSLAYGLIELAHEALRMSSPSAVDKLKRPSLGTASDAQTDVIAEMLKAYKRGSRRSA